MEEEKSFRDKLDLQQKMQLERLISYFGNQATVARELKFSKQTVNTWLRNGRISKQGAIEAEKYDPKYFKKEDMRPLIEW